MVVPEEPPSFSDRLFGVSHTTEKEEKVISYICHRLNAGAYLEDVLEEDYVRRNCTPSEIEEISRNPRLVNTARESMKRDFHSGKLNPRGHR